ncbi:o-succinylbenzoate synthase [Cyanobium sp. CH-040]|nr:o-succinylbenzoate synthase [Cyanobium sp. CH-040]
MQLCWRPFHLPLPRPLRTARGLIREKRGWLLRLEDQGGALGWGEAAPLEGEVGVLAAAIDALGALHQRPRLERSLPALPPSLGFALGAALAELDGLPRRRWLPAPSPAVLLPAGAAAPAALAAALAASPPPPAAGPLPFTCKWKVATGDDGGEREVLEELLALLPPAARLRLDANGGWDRSTAAAWAARLEDEPRLAWIEQPLDPADAEGLAELRRRFPRLPLALDESLRRNPGLGEHWSGWQVRRPSQEGDPRPLLAALERGAPHLVLSTAFETGIGRRWLHHLAALQAEGPTPAAPGLAPGWQAGGELGSADPERVWRAAGQESGLASGPLGP